MSDYAYQNYEELKKIEDSMFINTLQEIKENISDPFSPIPNRIISINLLRSMCKYHTTYFFNFFWGIRKDFIKNCLNYEQNTRLQIISFYFLNEILQNIYFEIPYGSTSQFIYWLYENIFIFLKKNNNNILKEKAENLIKQMVENMPCEAMGISLIKSLKEKDENINNFILQCIGEYFTSYITLGLDFNYIIENLEIEKIFNNKDYLDYYNKIKKVFSSFKDIFESNGADINQIIDNLNDKNKSIYLDLIK